MACSNCGQTFRDAEDFRDHLPCETELQRVKRELEEAKTGLAAAMTLQGERSRLIDRLHREIEEAKARESLMLDAVKEGCRYPDGCGIHATQAECLDSHMGRMLVAERAKVAAAEKRIPPSRFPIQGGPSLPWEMIAPHEEQARENHSQTLKRLAERGGLSPTEALAILDDRKYPWGKKLDEAADLAELNRRLESSSIQQLEKERAAHTETRAKLEAVTSELTELKEIHRRCDYDPRFD